MEHDWVTVRFVGEVDGRAVDMTFCLNCGFTGFRTGVDPGSPIHGSWDTDVKCDEWTVKKVMED